jgi:hypothetical protein
MRLEGKKYNSFLTSAVEGGERSVSHLGCALLLGKEPPASIIQEAVRAPEPVWTHKIEKKTLMCKLSTKIYMWSINVKH